MENGDENIKSQNQKDKSGQRERGVSEIETRLDGWVVMIESEMET